MKNINKVALSLVFSFFLNSCGGLSDVGKTLRNEKINSTDEFLVKKREPLVLPPDYDSLPEPRSEKLSSRNKEKNINQILKIPKEQNNTTKESSSVEQSIINEILK